MLRAGKPRLSGGAERLRPPCADYNCLQKIASLRLPCFTSAFGEGRAASFLIQGIIHADHYPCACARALAACRDPHPHQHHTSRRASEWRVRRKLGPIGRHDLHRRRAQAHLRDGCHRHFQRGHQQYNPRRRHPLPFLRALDTGGLRLDRRAAQLQHCGGPDQRRRALCVFRDRREQHGPGRHQLRLRHFPPGSADRRGHARDDESRRRANSPGVKLIVFHDQRRQPLHCLRQFRRHHSRRRHERRA